MGYPDEGHRADGLDDRAPVRNRLRKTRAQQAAFETDHRSFRTAEAQRAAVELVLGSLLINVVPANGGPHTGWFIDFDNAVRRPRVTTNVRGYRSRLGGRDDGG